MQFLNKIRSLDDTERKCLRLVTEAFFSKNVAEFSFEDLIEALYEDVLIVSQNALSSSSVYQTPGLQKSRGRKSKFDMPLLRCYMEKLCNCGFFAYRKTVTTSFYELALPFAELAHELSIGKMSWTNFDERAAEPKLVPAADRFVTLDHNSIDLQQAQEGLKNIKERVDHSNELKADKLQRLAIIREIGGLESLLDEQMVRVAPIWQAIQDTGILGWMARHGSDAVLTAIVSDVISHLLKVIGLN